MPNPSIEFDLKELFDKMDARLERMEQKLEGRLERIEQKLEALPKIEAELRGDIKALDEKVSGIGKRLDNQEFLNRSIFAGLILIVLGGAAKYFGFFPRP